jgi:hypothetical protein
MALRTEERQETKTWRIKKRRASTLMRWITATFMSTAMKMNAILMSIVIRMSMGTTMTMIPLGTMKPEPQAVPGKILPETEET